LAIPLLVFGVPAEYFWRKEVVKRDYERINSFINGDLAERAAVVNLVAGCWFEEEYNFNHHTTPENVSPIIKYSKYFRERVFGNCRSLQHTKLDKALLGSTNLSGADFMNADLSSASLYSANLSRTYLWSTNLTGADLSYANVSKAQVWNANLVGADLHHVDLSEADFVDANLSKAIFVQGKLMRVTFRNTNLSETDLSYSDLSEASLLWNTNLSGADLRSANLHKVKFDCQEYTNEQNQFIRLCPNLKDIQWDEETNWQGIQGWENVENIPPALRQQLELKYNTNDESGEDIVIPEPR